MLVFSKFSSRSYEKTGDAGLFVQGLRNADTSFSMFECQHSSFSVSTSYLNVALTSLHHLHNVALQYSPHSSISVQQSHITVQQCYSACVWSWLTMTHAAVVTCSREWADVLFCVDPARQTSWQARRPSWTDARQTAGKATSNSHTEPATEQVQVLADISHLVLCSHGNETHTPIANLPNSAQLDTSRIQQQTELIINLGWNGSQCSSNSAGL